MTLAELAEEYDRSLNLVKARLEELKQDPERNAVRIRDLEATARSTREIRDVCRDYYKKECRINGAYTVRYVLQRTPGRVPKMASGERIKQRGFNRPAQTESIGSNPDGTNDPATRNAVDAILGQLFSDRNRPRAGRKRKHREQDT